MGCSGSILDKDSLNLYEELTFLSKAEIIYLYKLYSEMFESTPPEMILETRVPYEQIMQKFPQIKYNPFRDRICYVFSSLDDGNFSFEDLLDLYSVMSEACPNTIKATWAFRLFDFDEDNGIGEDDIITLIDRLTSGMECEYENYIDPEHKREIAKSILEEMDIESSGSIGQMAFEHGVGKMTEFSSCFTFKI